MDGVNFIAAIGAACFGIVVGTIAGIFIGEAKEMTWRVATSTIGVFVGAGVVAMFELIASHASVGREIWFYPMGLLVGFFPGMLWLAYPPK